MCTRKLERRVSPHDAGLSLTVGYGSLAERVPPEICKAAQGVTAAKMWATLIAVAGAAARFGRGFPPPLRAEIRSGNHAAPQRAADAGASRGGVPVRAGQRKWGKAGEGRAGQYLADGLSLRCVTKSHILRTDRAVEVDMAVTRAAKQKVRSRGTRAAAKMRGSVSLHTSVLEEARRAGLLEGDKTEHVSLRAPPALVEAAKREAGISSTTELGLLALAMLARPDPVAAFFRRTEGRLGPDHDLEY